jgi:catechol 2,3-dioxygenase-like lactoylglutathione lyase family enzyme
VTSPRFTFTGVVLDAPDPRQLAGFYQRLLGWTVDQDSPEWVKLTPPGGGSGIAFQQEPEYVRPTWPSTASHQQMMMHLDVEVDDLAAASAFAETLGATLAECQPQEDVRVYLDPAGHPFCLWVPEPAP